MAKAKRDSGLSPEELEQIKTAQKRHTAFDPGCENLSPEQVINWHPIGGMSWEERDQRMKAAGVTDLEKSLVPAHEQRS